jgi:MFS family permease
MARSEEQRRERLTLGVLALSIFAFGFQQVSVLPTLNALQHNFHTTTAWSTWVVTSFLLFGSVATPLMGKLADHHGRKPLLQIVLAVFVVGSVGAALAPNIWALIAFRALSGVSATILLLGIALITEQFRPGRAAQSIAVLTGSLALANVVGVVTAPLLADAVSWRLMFVVVACIAGTALVLSPRAVSEVPLVRHPARLDVPGAVLLGLTIFALMLALTEASAWGWGSARILGLLGGALVAGAVWTAVELRTPEPLVELRMLARRTVLLTNLTSVLAGFATFGAITLVPRLLAAPRGLPPDLARLVDYGFHASSTVVGLYMAPALALGVVAGVTLGAVARRTGWKRPLVIGMALFAVGLAELARWHARPWQIVVALMVLGYGIPIATSIAAKLISDAVRPHERGIATGLNVVAYYFGAVLGAQVAAAILSADTIPGTSVPAASGYTISFYVSACVGLAGVPVALLITARRRAAGAEEPLPA